MKKLSVREQWMLAVLPTFLTGVFYVGLYAIPASTEREKLRKQIATQGPVSTRQAMVRSVLEENTDLKQAIDAQARLGTASGVAFNRSRALQFISQLCQNHGLTLISSAPDSTAKLPSTLQEAAAAGANRGKDVTASLWRIELRGSYAAMLEMLEGLRTAESLIVPLAVNMQTGGDERKPLSWMLTVWL